MSQTLENQSKALAVMGSNPIFPTPLEESKVEKPKKDYSHLTEEEIRVEKLKNILTGHNCDSCYFKDLLWGDKCTKLREQEEEQTCLDWEEKRRVEPHSIFKVVQMSYPNMIKGQIFQEFAMEAPKETIKYIRQIYGDKKDEDSELTQSKD